MHQLAIHRLTLCVLAAAGITPLWDAHAAQPPVKVAPSPEATATPTRAPRTQPTPVATKRPTMRPGAARASPKSRLIKTTMTAGDAPLPTDLVFEGLPANSVTVRSLVSRKRLLKALKVADMVLRREPRNGEVGMQRARLLYWLKRTDHAEKQATAVYRWNRYNTEALRLVGDIRLGRKDVHGAIRAYREAILRGDADYNLRLRLIDLYIGIDQPELANALLRPGMELPDELAWRLARALYRFQVEAYVAGTTFVTPSVTHFWQKAQLSASYVWSKNITWLAGVYGERRAVERVGSQLFGQMFFEYGRLSGDARLAFSPAPSDFLQSIDGWLEGAYNFGNFALGGWACYASYPTSPQLSIGPYAQFILGRLSIKPGYLFVLRGDFNDPQLDSTLFLRARYQMTVQTAAFAWLYLGQESVFATQRRLLAPDESAVALVLGAERWFGMRWGVRGMFTVVQFVAGGGGTLAELLIAARARF